MSNKREIDIFALLTVDTSELEAAEQRRDELAAKEIELRRNVEQTATRIQTIARGFIGLMRNIITLTGNALDVVSAASLIVIEQIIGLAVSWFALQTAIAAVPIAGQIIAGFSLGLAAIAVGIAIGQAVIIAQHRENTSTQINTAMEAIGNLSSIARGLGG